MGIYLDKPVSIARTDAERVQNLLTWANNTTQKLNTGLTSTASSATVTKLETSIAEAAKKLDTQGKTIKKLQALIDELDARVTSLEGG